MKNGWETKPLGQVAELRGRIGWRGLTAKEYQKSGPLFLSVHSLNHGDYVDFCQAFHITEERYLESPEIILQKDDVLICKDGAGIGKVGIVGELPDKATINSSLLLIRSGSSIFPKYLLRCLMSPYFQSIVNSRLEGATTPHLYQRDITTFPVVVPPIEEQRRIVAILDEAFASIDKAKANTEKNIQNARELFDSYLSNIFANPGPDWKRRSLKELTSKIGSGATPRGGKNAYKTRGISLIRSMNVHDRRFKPDNLAFIDSKQANELSNVTLQPNDVLINITGASIARSCLCPDECIPGRVNQHVSIIRANTDEIDPTFLNFTLTSNATKERLLNVGVAGGSTRQALTKTDLESFEIYLPTSIIEQHALSSKMSLCETETKEIGVTSQRKLRELDELKKSILQKAFSGEL